MRIVVCCLLSQDRTTYLLHLKGIIILIYIHLLYYIQRLLDILVVEIENMYNSVTDSTLISSLLFGIIHSFSPFTRMKMMCDSTLWWESWFMVISFKWWEYSDNDDSLSDYTIMLIASSQCTEILPCLYSMMSQAYYNIELDGETPPSQK